jgi:hypothetical protein
MEKIHPPQFFAQYPRRSNLTELKKADILVMPSAMENQSFTGKQTLFRELTDVDCRFYSEDQNRLNVYRELSAPSPDGVILFFGCVVSTIAGLIKIYEFLLSRTEGQKFRIKNVISFKDMFYQQMEFEGTIEDYKKFIDDAETRLKKE